MHTSVIEIKNHYGGNFYKQKHFRDIIYYDIHQVVYEIFDDNWKYFKKSFLFLQMHMQWESYSVKRISEISEMF